MSKDEELAVLDAAIAKLGADSYVGPWLASVRGEVEQSIRSDITPPMSWRAHYLQQERDQKLFLQRCAELEAQRNAQTDAQVEKARRKVAEVFAKAESSLRNAIAELR